MAFDLSQISFVLGSLVFASSIFMHLSKKNSTMVSLYAIQSLGVVLLMLISGFKELSVFGLIAIIAALLVKVIFGPRFFYRLIEKYNLKFNVNTYLKTPLTVIVIAVIVAFAYSNLFHPLSVLGGHNGTLLIQSLAVIFISLFLVVNRRFALSQIIGVLSMENAIVCFAIAAGLEQSPVLQLGIMFDIFVWIIIANVFISIIYKQFGTLDVAVMKKLQE